MNQLSKYLVLLIGVIPISASAFSQRDSIQKKHEISFGMPMFPFLYSDFDSGLGIGKELIEGPSLRTLIIPNISPSLNISYKYGINYKYKIRIGFEAVEVPNLFNTGTVYYLGQMGIQCKAGNSNKKIKTFLGFDILAGHFRF